MGLHVQRGFTLTELMVALALGSIVVGSMYGTIIQQRRVATQQEQVTEVRQNARVSMDAMVDEIRDTGFDPGSLARAGVIEADVSRFRFTRDLNCNGSLASSNTTTPRKGVPDPPPGRTTSDEDLAYALDTTQQELRRLIYADQQANPVVTQPVASNILSLQFCYFLASDVPNPQAPCTSKKLAGTDLLDIRAVQITLTARASAPDPSYIDPDRHSDPHYQHYHKATLTAFVRLRNLGINRGSIDGQPHQPRVIDFDETCALAP